MPAATPSQSSQSTMSTATTQSKSSSASSHKRKSMASATPASKQPHNTKRIKTEITYTTEPKASKSVDIVADSLYDAIVTVKVGELATSFGIHRGILRRASKFFREELALSEITEFGIVTQVVIMKEENPEIFRRFKNWLYSGTMISESETYKSLAWSDVIAVHSFADRRGIFRLQNDCVDAVIRKRAEGGLFPGQAVVNALWKAPGRVFRLRKLLLDMFATECDLRNAIANNGSYHPRFLQGLVQSLYEMKEKQTIYDKVDFWKRRHSYYVEDIENPILID